MEYTAQEFYLMRGLLFLLNPIELLLLLAPPTLIVWRILRNQQSRILTRDLWLYTLIAWPLIVAAQFLHYWLVGFLLTTFHSGNSVLEDMLGGDAIKLLMGTLFGGLLSLGYYLVWLVLISPLFVIKRMIKAKPCGGGYVSRAAGSPSPHR